MDKDITMAYKLKPAIASTTDESVLGGLGRAALSNVARAGETFLGLPGDIAAGTVDLISAATGGRTPTHKQLTEQDIKSGIPAAFQAPTSERLREGTKALTGEYLEPQNRAEKVANDFTQLVTALVTPGKWIGGLNSFKKIGQVASTVPKAAKLAGAATAGAEAVRALGGSEFAQEGTKLGILLASGLPGGRKALEQKAKDAYAVVESIPETVTHKVPGLESSINKLQKYTEVGHLTDDKKALQEFIGSVENSIEKGTKRSFKHGKQVLDRAIPVKELAQLEKDANQLLRDYNFPKQAKPFLTDLKKELEVSLLDYGKTNKPWLNAYEESKDIYRGLKSRSTINDFLQEHINVSELVKSKLAKAILFPSAIGSAYLSPVGTAVGAGVFATGLAIREGVKFGEFFFKSKNARKYYAHALKSALDNNKNAFIQSAKKLDHEAQKFEEENPVQGKWRLKS